MPEPKNARLGYGDVLRCLAALAVVTLHCSGATLAAEDPASARFFILNLLDGGTRWAVPMFVMLSGMFLLDPDRPMPARKWLGHLGRVALALLLWGFFYALWDARGAHLGLEWFLEALISMVTGRLHYHLWYLPMLLGLYLLLPSLRALVRGGSRRTLWYAIGLWGAAAVCLGTVYTLFPDGLFRPWLNMLDLQSLGGYAGLLLLGYLLRTCRPDPRWEGLVYALGAAGLLATWGLTHRLSLAAGSAQFPLYGYLTPNVCLTAAAIFLLCRRLEVGRHPIWARLSALTFGVYLVHPLLIELAAHWGLPDPAWSAAWSIPLQVLLVSAAAFALTWLLRHVPRVGKIIC